MKFGYPNFKMNRFFHKCLYIHNYIYIYIYIYIYYIIIWIIFLYKKVKDNASNKSTKLGVKWNNFMLNNFKEDNKIVFEAEVNITNIRVIRILGWAIFYINVYCYLLSTQKISVCYPWIIYLCPWIV